MQKAIGILLICLFNSILSFSQFKPGNFALKDVTLIDGISNVEKSHFTIIIRDNIIQSLGPVAETLIPDSVVVFSCTGKYLMPGLIDTHVHLATDPDAEDNRQRAERDLRDMLLSGITTVRDMAGDARALASLSRDASLDEIISPDIFYSALMAGPSFFEDPRTIQSSRGGKPGEMPFMKAVTDSTDLRQAIAEAKGTRATAIKLYAELSARLAERITAEAHKQGMQVWSHANLDQAKALDVINASVNVVSHAAMLSDWHRDNIPNVCLRSGLTEKFWDSLFKFFPVAELAKAIKANHTILDATVLVFQEAGSDPSLPVSSRQIYLAMFEMGRRFTRALWESGVPVCTGTDVDEKKFVQREMKILVKECGFSPMDALISATQIGARAIGLEKSRGTVEPRKIADLLLLSADPSKDIDNIDKVYRVIKNGKLYSNNQIVEAQLYD
jgi:imidazolonepropionase-like amidohydrolase